MKKSISNFYQYSNTVCNVLSKLRTDLDKCNIIIIITNKRKRKIN